MTFQSRRYVVVTPVRDEAAYLPLTIESMTRQTVLPTQWVLVNDGSTDETGSIIDAAAAQYDWIRPLHRPNRGYRQAGGGVVEAFNTGYGAITIHDWDYIVKLDGDLSFAPEYFERCLEEFERDPKLGIGGGAIYHRTDGELVLERCPAFHVRGATKIYRRACWEAIGGFWPAPGWDTMDEVKAQRLDWGTRSFEELQLLHHRPTGTADGIWRGLIKNGRANYICGYHPLFMIAKCAIRALQRPYFLGSAALLYGYVSGYTKHIPQVDDNDTIQYLRRQQIRRLTGKQTIWR